MDKHDHDGLVFDWSTHGPYRFHAPAQVAINDETLRDGLQSPSVRDPEIAEKIEILHGLEQLGIECASLGLPGAGPRQMQAVTALCREIADHGLKLRPNCGGRTLVADVEPIVEVAQRTGVDVEACLFIGSSPIRQYAEQWDIDEVLRFTREAVTFAVNEGLTVCYITEDTVRSAPLHLELLLNAAVDAGAARVCLCDTVGAAIPSGVMNLIGWVRRLLATTGASVGIDWHGHRDRGLGLANTLAAIQAGASRVHGTVLGIGERVGNTATEEILVNLMLLGQRQGDLSQLQSFVEKVAAALDVAIPPSTPIVGADAFRTATGVHAAAVEKALARGDPWVADRVYSSVPASLLGRRQQIEIGPLSGAANVWHFLRTHGLEGDSALVAHVLAKAKDSQRVLTEPEVLAIVAAGQVRR